MDLAADPNLHSGSLPGRNQRDVSIVIVRGGVRLDTFNSSPLGDTTCEELRPPGLIEESLFDICSFVVAAFVKIDAKQHLAAGHSKELL